MYIGFDGVLCWMGTIGGRIALRWLGWHKVRGVCVRLHLGLIVWRGRWM